ncbi:MAG: hypothetical protein AB8B53_07505 [Flavobacteriales bacterium]
MKNQIWSSILFFSVTALLLVGCAGLGKMEDHIEELGAKSSPEPLIVKGDKVDLEITGKFPEKYFHKKVRVEATPVLVYPGGEKAFKMAEYQGEDAAGNGTVIPYATGKSFSYTDQIVYDPAMENAGSLELRIYGEKGNKNQQFEPLAIGSGVITTPYIMKSDDMPIMASDNFQRVISKTNSDTEINYAKNRSNISSKELRDDDWKAMKEFVTMVNEDPRKEIKKISLQAYASPEGEISINEDLAQERAESSAAAVKKALKSMKIEVEDEDALFSMVPKGEDWEGFKSKMQASDIEDKELIIRVLEMYADKSKREEEIRNLAATFKEIEKKILPELRRSQIVLDYNETGYSDEELIQIGKTDPSSLELEELLKAGSLVSDMADKLSIYEAGADKFPNDYRSANNAAAIYIMQGDNDSAKTFMDKATAAEENKITDNNMGILARRNGDRAAALSFFGKASGAGSEVSYNKGLVQIQNGDYDSAISGMNGNTTFNTALVKMLNGDTSGASSDLESSGDDSAIADYLRAILAARGSNSSGVMSYLTSAIAKDSSLKDKAMKDLEFRDYHSQFSF